MVAEERETERVDLSRRADVAGEVLHLLEACQRPRSLDGFRATVLQAAVGAGFDAALFWLTATPDADAVAPDDPLPRGVPAAHLDRYLEGPWLADPFLSPAGVRALRSRPVVLLGEVAATADEPQRAYLRTFFGPRGYRDQATTWLRTGLARDGFLTVVCRRRITARERDLLALLRPHLAALLRWQLLAGQAAPGFDALSEREREVAALVRTGASNRDIGRALGISEATVKKHLTRIYAALGCRSRTELVAAAARL